MNDFKLSKAATVWCVIGILITGISLFTLWVLGLICFIIGLFVDDNKKNRGKK